MVYQYLVHASDIKLLSSGQMRQLFPLGKISLLLVLAWILVFLLVLSFYGQEDVLAAFKRERDTLTRNLQTMGKGEETEEAIRDAATPAEPSSAYEEATRKAAHDTRELWNFVRVRLKDVGKESSKIEKKLNGTTSELESKQQTVLVDLEQLRASDGFEEWRKRESKELSDLVQARLHVLQNPANCSSARNCV